MIHPINSIVKHDTFGLGKVIAHRNAGYYCHVMFQHGDEWVSYYKIKNPVLSADQIAIIKSLLKVGSKQC